MKNLSLRKGVYKLLQYLLVSSALATGVYMLTTNIWIACAVWIVSFPLVRKLMNKKSKKRKFVEYTRLSEKFTAIENISSKEMYLKAEKPFFRGGILSGEIGQMVWLNVTTDGILLLFISLQETAPILIKWHDITLFTQSLLDKENVKITVPGPENIYLSWEESFSKELPSDLKTITIKDDSVF
ncbi:hypothetical protein ACMZOO_12220 [Catenovulum sp. SX2]|uniref:hypothetical protein n=1 Tax=Catenovulum sp. SX2 TaxID=3398614 RepID=UPI003F85A79E